MLPTKEILTPKEVAELLQLTPDTVYRYIREGKLVASRLGRQYRIWRRHLELFLLSTSTVGSAQLRTFPQNQAKEWLEEDQIDQETGTIGKRLLKALDQSQV